VHAQRLALALGLGLALLAQGAEKKKEPQTLKDLH